MAKNNQHLSEKYEAVHYIVVVHGIGQQRKNETILPVIEQFAAARHNDNDPKQKSYLTLGQLTSQSKENLWIEYENIPDYPDPTLKKPWVPVVEKNSQGKNLRFVDFCWSDVLQESHEQVGESTETWTNSLINRLKLRVSLEPENKVKQGKSTKWMVDMMETMQEGMLFAEKILRFRLPIFSNEIFGEFLGDVEVYGDFPHTRGRAVRLFHETMAKVHKAHLAEFEDKNLQAHYTIIAHSLGTVLTMDAIAYAFANEPSRKSTEASEDRDVMHLPGYDHSLPQEESTQTEHLPSVDWIEYLHSYITLGSPIDKYLALWTENYTHFSHTDWMDEKRIAERNKHKIQHFNYADEQDPVGHELNILKSTPVWDELADIPEDIFFNRYVWPGMAHVGYWTDNQLFSRILDLNIDHYDKYSQKTGQPKSEVEVSEKQEIQWFKIGVYIKALLISFILIPSVGWLIATYCLNTVWSSYQTQGLKDFPTITFLILLGTLYLTHTVMKLLIEWHLVLGKSKRPKISDNEEKQKRSDKEKRQRESAKGILKLAVTWSPIVWGTLFLCLVFFNFEAFFPEFFFPLLMPLTVGLFLAFLVSFNIQMINRKMNKKWSKNSNIETEFGEYLKYLHK